MKSILKKYSKLWNKNTSQTPMWVWGYFSLILLLNQCTEVKKKTEVVPIDVFEAPIDTSRITTDTFGVAEITISRLNVNRNKPFGFTQRSFLFGKIDLKNDSTLAYIPFQKKGWKKDSGYIQVSQSGKSKEGFLRIFNGGFKDSIIKPPTPVIQWLKGTLLEPMAPVLLDFGDSRSLSSLKGMEESGAIIDSIWGFVFSASISPNNLRINYLTQGGIGNGLNFGTDQIYYRIKRPNGQFFRGLIPVLIGDTAQPNAENDELVLPASGSFISWNVLMANDLAANQSPPRQPSLLRLEPLPYNGKKSLKTQFGVLNDTTDNGSKAFYYRRNSTTTFADTTFIFLEEGPESRITRSRLIIKPN